MSHWFTLPLFSIKACFKIQEIFLLIQQEETGFLNGLTLVEQYVSKNNHRLSIKMPVQVYHQLTILMAITIPQNWEKRQTFLLLSICASQNTGLEYAEEEQVLEVVSMWHLSGWVPEPRRSPPFQTLNSFMLTKSYHQDSSGKFKTWGKSNYTRAHTHEYTIFTFKILILWDGLRKIGI